ncbi:MAG: flippase-like domain-containing protein [Actinomycetota bacterium]|nr:flippase-like domain-containing protein [Acidimicrobiia bacterium]MDQ3469991.1 flippase-like domain-containing protein [Actinomycetota bacterium]
MSELRPDESGVTDLALETGELPPIQREPSRPVRRQRLRPLSFTIKTVAFVVVIYLFVLPLVPDFQAAVTRLRDVEPGLLTLGVGLQVASWMAYSLLTRAALGDAAAGVSRFRLFRIQMSTKALSNIVPGGNAAASALGYRLLTLSGISGPDAGFALATAGLGSAVVLNLIFWIGLLVSIPLRGVNPGYAAGALAGVVIMLLAAGLVMGLMHGQGRAERILRWICAKVRVNGDSAAAVLRQIGARLEDLIADRALLKRVVAWAALNWLLDAASLWVFLRAFGETLDLDALIVAFGLANIIAVIPITPGGLGIVDAYYIPTLVAFGITRRGATLALATYRIAQFLLAILVGAVLYATLRVGPWRIERRDRLSRLRDLARRQGTDAPSESRVDFALRNWERTTRAGAPVVEADDDDQQHDEEASTP